jgi:hypothetical protein
MIMTEYKINENPQGKKALIRINDDGSISGIPMDESNSDYQRYLRWLENPNAEVEHLTEIVPADE